MLAVHEFHVWQLAGDRIIASAHIRCRNLSEYMKIAERVKEFFHNEGIHSTTIQPEFVEIEGIHSGSSKLLPYNCFKFHCLIEHKKKSIQFKADGIINNINGGSSQDCCALDCPTTEQGCIKQTCCQNSNKVSFSILQLCQRSTIQMFI